MRLERNLREWPPKAHVLQPVRFQEEGLQAVPELFERLPKEHRLNDNQSSPPMPRWSTCLLSQSTASHREQDRFGHLGRAAGIVGIHVTYHHSWAWPDTRPAARKPHGGTSRRTQHVGQANCPIGRGPMHARIPDKCVLRDARRTLSVSDTASRTGSALLGGPRFAICSLSANQSCTSANTTYLQRERFSLGLSLL